MNPVRFILENGITLERQPNNRWLFVGADNSGGRKEVDAESLAELAGLRPVVITEEIVKGTRIDFLVPKHVQARLLDIEVSELLQFRLDEPEDLHQIFNLNYITGAVVYHCKRLAYAYSDICTRHAEFPRHAGMQADKVLYGSQQEPYYEFDALVTAARRAYDTTRFMLWKYFGPGKGSVPASFRKCLPLCSRLPETLKHRLSKSWECYGEPLTNYRDCIQHYVPIDFGNSSAFMERLKNDVWGVSIRIPDNPEAKSKRNLSYKRKLDALNYGWEITTEVVSIAQEILKEISAPSHMGTQQGAAPDSGDATHPPRG